MKKYVSAMCILASAMSCQNERNHQAETVMTYQEEKPTIVFFPIIDSTSLELPWSLSDEFSFLIKDQLTADEHFSFSPSKGYGNLGTNPFETSIQWTKDMYPNSQFLVFLELIEHKSTPIQRKNTSSSSLNTTPHNLGMAMRIRIIDNRDSSPKIILQELVKDNYYIPKNILPINYSIVRWGTKDYPSSPMGTAHVEMSKEIAERISDYIHLAITR